MKTLKGDLIDLAKKGLFDFIGHGCNCHCKMKSGLAPQMAKAFGCDRYPLEDLVHYGDKSKLGRVEMQWNDTYKLWVGNMYTQYYTSTMQDKLKITGIPFNYDAFLVCLRYINKNFADEKIGLPLIGCGRARGDKNIILSMIEQELKDCDVTIVEL
jgi:O-acetyl-ADP-ribose deacetylase (regulator of RNase III)